MVIVKCCVIDDEPLAAQLLTSYIEKTPYMKLVGTFASAQEAIKTIMEEEINVIFLDIQMPQLNGIEFAKIIPSTTRIIFTTAYENYAIQGFKVNALDYLLKPISYEEFLSAANKALTWLETYRKLEDRNIAEEYIIVKSEYKLIQIPVANIVFVEGLKDYVKIYTDNEPQPIMTLMSMKAIERTLPSNHFMRVHRSFIVNTTKIKLIERNRIVFGKHYIPVSETYKQIFTDYVNAHTLTATERDSE